MSSVATSGRPFSTLIEGERIAGALTVTETHVTLAAAIFNDPGPNHVNKLHAERSRWGARIAHGPLVIGIMDGVLGNEIGGHIVALLEESSRFLHPTFLGDTVICDWVVDKREPKPAFAGGGIVTFDGVARNQSDDVLVKSRVALAVGEQPAWGPTGHVRQTTERGAT